MILYQQLSFYFVLFLLLFTYVGYPVVLMLMVRLKGSPEKSPVAAERPALSISLVLVARNEENRITARLENLLECSPPALKELIVVCDGCTDTTPEKIRAFADSRLRLVELQPGKGKPAGLNHGVHVATGDVIVFCDARQRFERETISRLVRWFSDPENGAVSGTLEVEPSKEGTGQGVDAYWRLEKLIRRLESELDSSIGCTGAIYAIRRSAYKEIPEDTILDDVTIPMLIAASGFRVRFCPESCAYDPQSLSGATEQRRKIRTLAGNFQMLFRYKSWLLPWKNRLWWKLIVHKYFRLLGPVFLLSLLLLSFALRQLPFYAVVFGGQVLLYLISLFVWKFPRIRHKLLTLPSGFIFLQACIVQGFFYWLTGRASRGWK